MGSSTANYSSARLVLEQAIGDRIFPAATVEVGNADQALWKDALGTLTFDADKTVSQGNSAAAIDTPFDLASLTKVIATATVVMDLIGSSQLGLDERLSSIFAEWLGSGRENVTVGDLLEHASGLPARLIGQPPSSRREFEHEICATPLAYAPRSQSVYSDLDFILLGFLAADRGDASLVELFDQVWLKPGITGDTSGAPVVSGFPSKLGADSRTVLTFHLGDDAKRRAAPTRPLAEDPRRGRLLRGEVHDNYAASLGGVAGHAGLFGTAPAVGLFARQVLRAARGNVNIGAPFLPELVARFTSKSTVPGSSRALGWDTMLPSSSCGTRMSASAFGHVGFTGTSLWIDPKRDRYFVLLTNRACGGGTLDAMRTVRRAFHDQITD